VLPGQSHFRPRGLFYGTDHLLMNHHERPTSGRAIRAIHVITL